MCVFPERGEGLILPSMYTSISVSVSERGEGMDERTCEKRAVNQKA